MADVLDTARRALGTTESPANSNKVRYNTWYYGREVSGDAYPWCMAFVQWVFAQAGKVLPYKIASCSALLSWYRQNRPECIVRDPMPGDIILYTFSHTGIVESVQGSTVTAIEGNTSAGSSGSQANGGGVFRRTRNKSLVRAYIRPIKKEDDMDQEKFNQMFKTAMEAYRKDLRDNDSGQWSREAREYAISSGLFAGSGTTPDGQPNYMWEDLLNREQVAQLFYRFAQRNGLV